MADLTCTTPMCTEAHAKVDAMWATFNALKDTYPNFDVAHFQPTVQTIQAELDAVHTFYETWIPFNPACCSEHDTGVKAETVTNQMLASVGANPLPQPPPSTDWTTLVILAGAVLLAITYAPQIKSALRK